MKPALTKEEWEEGGPEHWTLTPDANDGFRFEYGEFQKFHSLCFPNRKGVAALALFDTPFGFAREDVEMLRTMAFGVGGDGMDGAPLEELADRIEALLPPEGVKPWTVE